jgi:hypothetical protein
MSKVKSPVDKKRLVYDRDHVTPAEYPHAFRKQWPRKKAKAERAARRKVRQVLQVAAAAPTRIRSLAMRLRSVAVAHLAAKHR